MSELAESLVNITSLKRKFTTADSSDLSLAPDEQVSKDRLIDVSQECAKKLGFDAKQFIAIYHNDTGHSHSFGLHCIN